MGESMESLRRIAADNLLVNCAGVRAGTEVLFVNEASKGVDREVIAFLEQRARELGATVRSIWPARAESPEAIPDDVAAAIENAPITIFNHQIGPLLRLRPIPGKGIRVLNYATTPAVLDSEFARIPHGLWVQVLDRFVARLREARKWRITCPLGTDVSGEFVPAPAAGNATGFSLRSFPLDTHSPIASPNAKGKVAFRWFVTSGTHDLGTEGMTLDAPVIAHLDGGRIRDFEGSPAVVDAARTFLGRIGERYGKDPFIVNSWHAGTNPQACVALGAAESLEYWMLLAHANPRILHFHVVGEKIPGEISATLVDATVTLDGDRVWDAGKITAYEDPAYQEIAARFPGGKRAFVQSNCIGV
jgi:hypothetical protein